MKPKAFSASSSAATTRSIPPPTREQIEALAHAIWIDRGCPEGRELDHWLEAERQLKGEVRAPAAADDIPATSDPFDPDQAVTGPVDRELDHLVAPREQRSPTSL
jgi:hypothetical protein